MAIRIEELVTREILPRANNSYDIGTSSNKYKTIYATSFDGLATNAARLSNTSAIGGGKIPIYFSANGVPVASTSTEGGSLQPVYLNSGIITKTTYRMAATNTAATTAVAIADDLETGIWYVNGISNIFDSSVTDGAVIVNKYSSKWISEIYQDYRTGQLAIRGKNNGTWTAWRKVLDSSNFSTYLNDSYVKKSGDTMSGTLYFGSTSFSITNAGAATFGVTAVSTLTASSNVTVKGIAEFQNTTKITKDTPSTSKSTGALLVSNGAGIGGQLSAGAVMVGDHALLSYNTTDECLYFTFS